MEPQTHSFTPASKAFETSGAIDAQRRLMLNEPLPIAGPVQVRVIILVHEEADIDEGEWLHAASANPAFDFLKQPEEDLYSSEDGRPYHDGKRGQTRSGVIRFA